jgi:acetyl-CoA decarbonylase/synthase complex subunit gamma
MNAHVSQSAAGGASSSGAPHWGVGSVDTPAGRVPRVSTTLTFRDRLGAWRVRWGGGRNRYTVAPQLYAVGSPTPDSYVLVTANYKLSFDRLRSQLAGRDAWILVLDTNGINVWCAAGKGTFGTDELVRRLERERVAEIVSHHRLVLPQLGGTGVSAHQVRARTGWRVNYGPVRAEDLPAFLEAGLKATPEMRRVRFAFADRITLVPVELVGSAKYLIAVVTAFVILSGLWSGGYSTSHMLAAGSRSVFLLLAAYVAGAALAPALLPWIPGHAFSLKGGVAGLGVVGVVMAAGWFGAGRIDNWAETIGWVLLVPVISSFLTMNFTGASTYTSLSGVRREMRVAVPIQIAAAFVGLGMWVAGRFL